MENLFKFATKELSQDAFLRWVFANYRDPSIGQIGKSLLCEMINIGKTEKIQESQIDDIATFGQVEKMDIVVDFTVDKTPCVLIIEDKTSSDEHGGQLSKYKKIVLEKWNSKQKDRPSYFVFYKTHKIDNDERARIKIAEWNEFEFDAIKDFWSKYKNHENIIISQYANHVIKCWENCHNLYKPEDNNIDQWIGYFENTIKPQIKIECDSWIGSTYYGYAYFCIRPKGRGGDKVPYLEIRSRDCLKGNFEARILMYGVDQKYLVPIRNAVRARESNNIFKGDYGEKKNKQVAHTHRNDLGFKAANDEEFIKATSTVISEYLEIFKTME